MLVMVAYSQHFGFDRMNGDLPGYPIDLIENPTWQECERLCNENPECEIWALQPANCPATQSNNAKCWLKKGETTFALNNCRVSGVKDISLTKVAFERATLGHILPNGWIKNWLNQQAESLSGHLQEFWADIQDSSWIGGNHDGGLHERFPYWMNGVVPMAYELNNTKLIKQVEQLVSFVLENQSTDGWIGPDDATDADQYWSKFPMINVLLIYREANPDDTRIIPAVKKLYHEIFNRMLKVPYTETSWSGARWADLVYTVHKVMEEETDKSEKQFLFDLAELAHKQGFDWDKWYNERIPHGSAEANQYTHGVNNAQAMKGCAVWSRQSRDPEYKNKCLKWVNTIMEYHGQAYGLYAADEHLAGRNPSRGTELCTVVEWMESMDIIGSILGDSRFFDYSEMAAYNAFPATMTSDMWAHQYLQLANQVEAKHMDPHPWVYDGPDSILYGLEPNFGCCTANFNQGLPKFVRSMIMKGDNSYDEDVVIEVTSLYPFEDTYTVHVDSKKDTSILLRHQSFSDGMMIKLDGYIYELKDTEYYGFGKVEIKKGVHDIIVENHYHIRAEKRFNDAISMYRGGLLFSLPIGEQRNVLRTYYMDSKDYEMLNTTAWNYGIYMDIEHPDKYCSFEHVSAPHKTEPFSIDNPPVRLVCSGASIEWGLENNNAAPPPQSPVKPIGEKQEIVLVPYGNTDIRISEIPSLEN
ncbi:hypothetical protein WA158_008311 [Blastocystis sp. Blastoise]